MPPKDTIVLRDLGLRDNEVNVLKSLCTLSSHSARRHTLRRAHEDEEADLYIVGLDDEHTRAGWEAHGHRDERPTIFISTQPSTNPRTLKRPIIASRLLAMIDDVVAPAAGPAETGTATPAAAATNEANQGTATPNAAPAAAPALAKSPAAEPGLAHLPPGASALPTAAPRATRAPVAATLPVAPPAPAPAAAPSAPAPERAAPVEPRVRPMAIAGKPSVLVIDDSPTVRKRLELVLRELGAVVVCAASGEEGLELMSRRMYELVLLDVVLPGADGYQVCKQIKANIETRATPVVMLTSKSSPFDRIRGSLAGCDTYLTKPVDARQFLSIATRHLKLSPMRGPDTQATGRSTQTAGLTA